MPGRNFHFVKVNTDNPSNENPVIVVKSVTKCILFEGFTENKIETMRKRKRLGGFCWVVILILLIGELAGCSKSASPPNSSNNPVTYLSVMNLAPYTPSTEVYLNNVKGTVAIPAGGYSNSYAHLSPGSYDVKFKVAGSDSVLAGIPASDYDSMSFYTLILYNDSLHGRAKAMKIADDFSGVTINNTYIRFLHMCLELPAVDLYLNNSKTLGNRTVTDNVSNHAFNNFQSVTAGYYNLQVKKAGTDTVLGNLNNISLSAGNAYTIFLSGSATNGLDPISLNILRAVY